MKFDDALHEIGAPPGSSLEEARRAYSRKTRTWNPASDPDGLRRLREAWEVVQAALSPPPLPSAPAPVPAPLPGPLPEASPTPSPAAASPERKIRLLPMEPVAEKKEEPGRLRRVLIGAALSALVVLSFRINAFRKANEAPTEPPTRMPPTLFFSYASSQEAVSHVCPQKPPTKPFCVRAMKFVEAIEAHKCSDAEIDLKMLDSASLRIYDRTNPQAPQRHDTFYAALEADLERCWKFWNP